MGQIDTKWRVVTSLKSRDVLLIWIRDITILMFWLLYFSCQIDAINAEQTIPAGITNTIISGFVVSQMILV